MRQVALYAGDETRQLIERAAVKRPLPEPLGGAGHSQASSQLLVTGDPRYCRQLPRPPTPSRSVAAAGRAAPRLKDLDAFLLPLAVLAFECSSAHQAARIRANLDAAGTPIGLDDILIAATAIRYSATRITRNVRDSGRIPELHFGEQALRLGSEISHQSPSDSLE